jgi:hypothetical protein
MITATGYSKDPSIMPEGIVITFGKEMINDHGGLLTFIRGFVEAMSEEDNGWCHKLKNKPKFEVDHVYIIIANRLAYRCYFGGSQHFKFDGEKANGAENNVDWPGIYLAGPLEKCPFKRTLKGFQGFRYCTKLF